jgi:hypothetical protein
MARDPDDLERDRDENDDPADAQNGLRAKVNDTLGRGAHAAIVVAASDDA